MPELGYLLFHWLVFGETFCFDLLGANIGNLFGLQEENRFFLQKDCRMGKMLYFCSGLPTTRGLNPEKRGYMPLCPKCRG